MKLKNLSEIHMKKLLILLLFLPVVGLSQSFQLFDIDTTNYPTMKAKYISLDKNSNIITGHSKDDIIIHENGTPVEITHLNSSPNTEPISLVVVISMETGYDEREDEELVKQFLSSLINSLPNNGSEMCINVPRDFHFKSSASFSQDKNVLAKDIKKVGGAFNEYFDLLFVHENVGSLSIIDTAKHSKRKILLVNSGYVSGDPENTIIKANEMGVKIDSYNFRYFAYNSLWELVEATGGNYYRTHGLDKNLPQTLDNIAKNIIGSYSEIEWNALKTCNSVITLKVLDVKNGVSDSLNYELSSVREQALDISETFVNFGKQTLNTTIDTVVTVISNYSSITINDIIFEPNYEGLEIRNQLPITLSKGEPFELDFRIKAINESREYIKFTLKTDFCDYSGALLIGGDDPVNNDDFINLNSPNGGEVYNSGEIANIEWSGNKMNKTVNINYSTNNGSDWNYIDEINNSNSYKWILPDINSDSCLVSVDVSNENTGPKKEGDIVWSKTYGYGDNDKALKIIEANDGGYLVLSILEYAPSFGDNIFITKLSEEGNSEWVKSFEAPTKHNEFKILNTNDDHYIVVAEHRKFGEGFRVEKFDNYGNTIWSNIYSGYEDDIATDAIYTSDDYIIIVGTTESDNGIFDFKKRYYTDFFMLKLDKNGNTVWIKSCEVSGRGVPSSIIESFDSNYVFTFYTYGDYDIQIYNIDTNGTKNWSNVFKGDREDKPYSIVQRNNGGYSLVGITNSNEGHFENYKPFPGTDPFIINIDTNGNHVWTKVVGGRYQSSYAYSVINGENESLLLSGILDDPRSELSVERLYGYDNSWLMKIDNNNKVEYIKNYGGSRDDQVRDMIRDKNGDYVLVGNTLSEDFDLEGNNIGGWNDNWILKVKGSTVIEQDNSDDLFSIKSSDTTINSNDDEIIQLLHNIQEEEVIVKLKLIEDVKSLDIVVYDQLGNKIETVYSGELSKGEKEFTINLESYFSSRYYVRLITPTFSKTKFIEVLK